MCDTLVKSILILKFVESLVGVYGKSIFQFFFDFEEHLRILRRKLSTRPLRTLKSLAGH